MIEFIKYAGGLVILVAGVILGYIIGFVHHAKRKTKAYKRAQAQLPRATKRN